VLSLCAEVVQIELRGPQKQTPDVHWRHRVTKFEGYDASVSAALATDRKREPEVIALIGCAEIDISPTE
jgi:hypothetical protein